MGSIGRGSRFRLGILRGPQSRSCFSEAVIEPSRFSRIAPYTVPIGGQNMDLSNLQRSVAHFDKHPSAWRGFQMEIDESDQNETIVAPKALSDLIRVAAQLMT